MSGAPAGGSALFTVVGDGERGCRSGCASAVWRWHAEMCEALPVLVATVPGACVAGGDRAKVPFVRQGDPRCQRYQWGPTISGGHLSAVTRWSVGSSPRGGDRGAGGEG